MTLTSGIRLEHDGQPLEIESLEVLDERLIPVRARIWPHDLTGLADELREFLADPDPTPDRVAEVKPRFLLSRDRLVEIIGQTGREPHVPGGGELVTVDETHGATYPQLYVARPGDDYSRFDRFHVNIGLDGTPVDDVVQLLFGSGLVVKFRTPSGDVLGLRLSCPSPDAGWLIAVDCSVPFIGSFTEATPGAKAVSQTIGPKRWEMRYVD